MQSLWTCDDEDEARGLVTVLERAGILVELRDVGGQLAIDVSDQAEPRARALLGRVAGAHARRLDAQRDTQRRNRERLFQHAAWIAGAITAVVWLVIVAS